MPDEIERRVDSGRCVAAPASNNATWDLPAEFRHELVSVMDGELLAGIGRIASPKAQI